MSSVQGRLMKMSKNNLAEFQHSLIVGSSYFENLLEASIYRIPSKLAVRDKFEFLLYQLRLQPSSASDLHVALNALHGMSYQC